MRELNRIKIYAFAANDVNLVKKGNTEEEVYAVTVDKRLLETKQITITENFLMRALECYLQKKFRTDELTDIFVKVMLKHDYDFAKNQWMNGIYLNEKKYISWIATTGGMKEEDNEGICNTFFIREDYKQFIDELENVISLGIFKEIEESKKEICINKDILSRISLVTGNSYDAGELPNIIILPQAKKHWKKMYKAVDKIKYKEEDQEKIKYELKDYMFDDSIDIFDGGGIATPSVFEQIRENLDVNYNVEFAIIRAYNVAIKGLVTKFNIKGYLDINLKENTDYCRKLEDGSYEILDMFDNWRPLTDKTLILNESMVKLAKYHESWDNVLHRIDSVDEKYKEIINRLYVTKINKDTSSLTEYIRTNYQLINAIAVTKQDLKELTKEDFRMYNKMLNCFDVEKKDEDGKVTDWVENLDTIKLFYRNIVNKAEDIDDAMNELIDKKNTICDRVEALINISDKCANLQIVRKDIAKTIEKKCRELATGKFHVKGDYKYLAIDAIAYMNYAIHRKIDDGLEEYEYYNSDCSDSETRTIARNPLCYWGEVHNIKFKKNEFYDNWYSNCRELLYVNCKDDIHMLTSGADNDGDGVTIIDNEVIRKAVVGDLKSSTYIINTTDKQEVVNMIYNKNNRFEATYKAAGNIIGEIALKAASVNSDAQAIPSLYSVAEKRFVALTDISSAGSKEEKIQFIKEKKENGEWVSTYKMNQDVLRELIKKQFQEQNLYSAIVLTTSMLAIDAPKTLSLPSKEDMEVISKKYGRKEWFLQYRKSSEEIKNLDNFNKYYNDCNKKKVMNYLANKIKEELLDKIENTIKEFKGEREEVLQQLMCNNLFNKESYDDCFKDITALYKDFSKENQEIHANKKEVIKVIDDEIKMYYSDLARTEAEFHFHIKQRIKECKKEKSKIKSDLFKGVIHKYLPLAENYIKKYDCATVCQVISNLENCTERFIVDLFKTCLSFVDNYNNNKRVAFVESAEEDTVHFMYKDYKKIYKENTDSTCLFNRLQLEDKKRVKLIKINAIVALKYVKEDSLDILQELLDKDEAVLNIVVDNNIAYLCKEEDKLFQNCNNNYKIGKENLLSLNGKKIKIGLINKAYKSSVKVSVIEIEE